jgi:hypothetical protein
MAGGLQPPEQHNCTTAQLHNWFSKGLIYMAEFICSTRGLNITVTHNSDNLGEPNLTAEAAQTWINDRLGLEGSDRYSSSTFL